MLRAVLLIILIGTTHLFTGTHVQACAWRIIGGGHEVAGFPVTSKVDKYGQNQVGEQVYRTEVSGGVAADNPVEPYVTRWDYRGKVSYEGKKGVRHTRHVDNEGRGTDSFTVREGAINYYWDEKTREWKESDAMPDPKDGVVFHAKGDGRYYADPASAMGAPTSCTYRWEVIGNFAVPKTGQTFSKVVALHMTPLGEQQASYRATTYYAPNVGIIYMQSETKLKVDVEGVPDMPPQITEMYLLPS